MEIGDIITSERRFEAVSALVVYRLDAGYDGKAHYVTLHDVVQGKLSEGRPITQTALVNLCASVMPEIRQTVKFIPPDVLAYTPGHDHGVMMWWKPAGVRHLYFHPSTGVPCGPAPVPATLFMVRAGALHVWALDAKERPGPDAPVYHPPFFNVFSSGMCMGNMKPPKVVRPQDIHKWEALFFDSAFTEEAEPQLEGIKCKALWKRLITRKAKTFPLRHLKPYRGMKIKNLLEGVHG